MRLTSIWSSTKSLVVLIILINHNWLSAQFADTVVSIKPIVVESGKSFSSNNESLVLIENLTDESPVFVKNYGPSSIATISYRGGASSQTNVSWNGIPINNPSLGLTDFSLINSFFIDKYRISSNTSVAPNINGQLSLYSNLDTNRLSLQSTFGSFGLRNNGIKASKKFGRIHLGVRMLRVSAQNDFPYKIGSERFITDHSDYRQNGYLLESKMDLKHNMTLSGYSWFTNTYRQIPPTTRQSISEATQEDKIWRNALNFMWVKGDWSLNTNLGYSFEEIIYKDDQIDLVAPSQIESWHFSNKLSKSFNKLELHWNNVVNYAMSQAPSFGEVQDLAIFNSSLFGRFDIDKFWAEGEMSIATNFSNGEHMPWMIKLGSYFSDLLSASFQMGHQVRFATINDMFWNPGGNIDVKPEKSTNFELSFEYDNDYTKISVSGYYRDVKDWILWAQDHEGPFFSVQNIAEVKTRGIETLLMTHHSILKNLSLDSEFNGTFNLSENQKDIQSPNIRKGDQLYYTPKYKLTYNLTANYKKFHIRVEPQFVSSTRGLNEDLNSYFIANSSLGYNFSHQLANASLRFDINNVFNTENRIIEFRPMPGVNYRITLNFNIL